MVRARRVPAVQAVPQRTAVTLVEAPMGHACRTMNFAWGALAAETCGPEILADFWKIHRHTIRRAPNEHCLFKALDRPDRGYHDRGDGTRAWDRRVSISAGEMYGPAWTTPMMLLVWQAGRGRSILSR